MYERLSRELCIDWRLVDDRAWVCSLLRVVDAYDQAVARGLRPAHPTRSLDALLRFVVR